MSNKRRTKIEMIRDTLEVMERAKSRGKGFVNKTEIVYGANLNFKRASRILKWLIDKELVKAESKRYKITEKGEQILREIEKLIELLKN